MGLFFFWFSKIGVLNMKIKKQISLGLRDGVPLFTSVLVDAKKCDYCKIKKIELGIKYCANCYYNVFQLNKKQTGSTKMTSFLYTRQSMQLSQSQAAALLGAHVRTVSRWERWERAGDLTDSQKKAIADAVDLLVARSKK